MIDILKTKLLLIDRDCESAARLSINEFYEQVKYEGGKFLVPSFKDVAKVWLKVILRKEQLFNAEIIRISERSNSFLKKDQLEEAQKLVARYFDEDLYLKRLEGFVDGVRRKAAAYGVQFNPQMYRLDLDVAAFAAGVKNNTRRGLSSVFAELKLCAQNEQTGSLGMLEKLNKIIDLKPNIMGFGLNLNALIERFKNFRR